MNRTNNEHTLIPNWFFTDGYIAKLGKRTSLVFALLQSYCPDEDLNQEWREANPGEGGPSMRQIEVFTGISRKSTLKAIKELEKFGLIEVRKQTSKSWGGEQYRIVNSYLVRWTRPELKKDKDGDETKD